MKFPNFIVSIFLFSCFLNANSLNIGVLYNGVYVSEKEAIIASKIWNKHMTAKEYGVDVKAILYDSVDKLLSDYENEKIMLLVISPNDYYLNREKIEEYSEKRWVLSHSKKKITQFYLLENVASSFGIKNLPKVKIMYRNELSRKWLEMEAFKLNINDSLKFEKVPEEKKLIFDVFFDKNKFSIVQKDLYDEMIELNPQILIKTKIINKSKETFFTTLGFDRIGTNEKYADILKKVHDDINDENKNIKSLNYMKVSKFFYLNEDEFADFLEFKKRYNEFKRRK